MPSFLVGQALAAYKDGNIDVARELFRGMDREE